VGLACFSLCIVQLPVYQNVNDQQLTSRYSIRMGLSQAF